jgi:hypothetical protein
LVFAPLGKYIGDVTTCRRRWRLHVRQVPVVQQLSHGFFLNIVQLGNDVSAHESSNKYLPYYVFSF